MKRNRRTFAWHVAILLFWLGPGALANAADESFGALTRLADAYGSDKGHAGEGHLFAEFYEHFFYPIRQQAKKIAEIGIAEGASLKMFRDYFPEAVIYGIDINDSSGLNADRIRTFVADQGDRRQLGQFIQAFGSGFDVIIDDGGHTMRQQQISIGYLFSHVKPGGYYVIEDVHTSLYPVPNVYERDFGVDKSGANSTLRMIERYIRTGKIRSQYLYSVERNYLEANIQYCNLFSRNTGSITCLFKKK